MSVWWWIELQRGQWHPGAELSGLDVLQPLLVRQRSIRAHPRWWLDEQSGALSGAAAADQRSGCRLGFALLDRESRTTSLPVGYDGHLSLDAQGFPHLLVGDRLSPLEHTVFCGFRRGHSSWREQRFPCKLCLQQRRQRRYREPGGGGSGVRGRCRQS